ncbi:MAG TPA: flagellar motor protein MotB, partial [Desulfopila sp.]|nr:flagellar motor protein MotB [Desulfopila sp.]
QRLAETTIFTQSNQSPTAQIIAQTGQSDTDSAQTPVLAEPIIEPQPLATEEPGSVNDIFSRSRKTLDVHNLDQFASIGLIPDKAVRIVLTGDLLFEPGHAALSQQAIDSLEKIAEAIGDTRHTVHIEGHTDDVPIFAGRYANNWELSIARANAVANFLIEDMGMEPQQFVISGFSSYKPLAPNTTVQNRAANRRVEIVIAQPQKRQDIAFRETTNTTFQTL